MIVPVTGVPTMVCVTAPNEVLVVTPALAIEPPPMVLSVVIVVPVSQNAFELDPGGSRSTINTSSGPDVIKFVPLGNSPSITPSKLPLPLHCSSSPLLEYIMLKPRV